MARSGDAGWLDTACFANLLVLLFWAPLPLGSNRNWSLGLLALAVWVLVTGAGWSLVWRGRSPWAYLSAARWPLLGLCLYVALVAAQMLGGPSGKWFYSAEPFQTRHYLLSALAALGGFVAVLLLARDERRLRVLALALVGSGVLQALLAIALWSAKARYQFMYVDLDHGARTYGTFVNHNHFASYLYLCMSVGIGLLVAGLGESADRVSGWKERLAAAMRFVMSPRMLLRLLLVVTVIALVLTRSRMGNIAFFVSVLLLGVVVAVRFRHSRRLALLLVGSLLLVDVIVVGQWVGLDRVMQRIEGTVLEREDEVDEESVEMRTEPGRLTVPMVLERPWLGHGGGTYFTVFPRFKSPAIPRYYDHAHNDYAEIAADTGLVGLALLAGVALLSLRRAWRLLHPAQDVMGRAGGGAVFMAVLCIGLHSTVDFSLQIPAVAFTFMLVLGLAWSSPLRVGLLSDVQGRSRSEGLSNGMHL